MQYTMVCLSGTQDLVAPAEHLISSPHTNIRTLSQLNFKRNVLLGESLVLCKLPHSPTSSAQALEWCLRRMASGV